MNLVLELVLVYGFDLGIAGSAWGTVIAQLGAAVAYVVIVAPHGRATGASVRPRPRRRPDRRGRRQPAHRADRRRCSLALLVATTAVAARIGDDAVAAHQIAFQIWTCSSRSSLDAIAIAGQAIVGRFLGAADAPQARAAARRMLEWGVVVGVALRASSLAVARPSLVPLFTDDAGVCSTSRCRSCWIVALAAAAQRRRLRARRHPHRRRRLAVPRRARWLARHAARLRARGVVVAVLDGGLLWLWGAFALWIVARCG